MNISHDETLNEMKMRWEKQSTDKKMEELDKPGVTEQIYLFIGEVWYWCHITFLNPSWSNIILSIWITYRFTCKWSFDGYLCINYKGFATINNLIEP